MFLFVQKWLFLFCCLPQVDIYESRPFIGGKVASFQDKDGNHVEMGLHVFFGKAFSEFVRNAAPSEILMWLVNWMYKITSGRTTGASRACQAMEILLHAMCFCIDTSETILQAATITYFGWWPNVECWKTCCWRTTRTRLSTRVAMWGNWIFGFLSATPKLGRHSMVLLVSLYEITFSETAELLCP